MLRSSLRALLWVATASAILVLGFALFTVAFYWLARAFGSLDPAQLNRAKVVLVFYFQIVAIRGLLPQLLLGLALWWGLASAFPRFANTRGGLAAGLAVAAALAYGVVAPLLLTASFEGWPVFKMRGFFQHIVTFVMMTASVVAAGLLPRLVLPPLRLGSSPVEDSS